MNKVHLPGIDNTLANTLILALAVHGFILLAVDFESPREQSDVRLQSLEVTVVTQSTPEEPRKSDYFAQQNQSGGGNSEEAHKPTLSSALQGESDIYTDDINRSEFSPPRQAAQQREERESPRLTVSISSPFIITNNPADDTSAGEPSSPAELLANLSREITRLEAELDDETEAFARFGRRKTISAATREHSYATYMEQWRRRVEEVGNLNYPEGATGSVVVHIAVRSDGSVEKIRILKPSSSSLVNESALSISRLAAPFPPFPDSIRSKTDILDIIRTWHFQQNARGVDVKPLNK